MGLGGGAGAVGNVMGMIGSLAGGMISDSMLGQGMHRAGVQNQRGIDYLKRGNDQQQENFKPYIKAGQHGLGSYQHLLAQGNQSAMPQQSGAFSFDKWQDPSAQWSMDQANKAIQASMLAKGAAGGGMAKALQANAANLGGQQYQNAFQRYLSQNQQDFGQQQQIYGNQTQNYQNQLAGYGGLASQGQQAAGTSGQLGLGYGNAVMGGYQHWGDQELLNMGDRAGVMGKTVSGLGKDLGSLVGSF